VASNAGVFYRRGGLESLFLGNWFGEVEQIICRDLEKRRQATALQHAGAFAMMPGEREAFGGADNSNGVEILQPGVER
jgi:hypothetical protein